MGHKGMGYQGMEYIAKLGNATYIIATDDNLNLNIHAFIPTAVVIGLGESWTGT